MLALARRRGALLTALLAAIALAVAGCGDDAPTAATASPTPTVETTMSPTPTASPTASPSPTPTAAPASTPPPLAAGVLRSYRYRVDIEFVLRGTEGDVPVIVGSVEGDYVAPDRHRFTNAFSIGAIRFVQEVASIGDEAWIREGTGAWRATPANAAEVVEASALTSADPAFPAGDTPLAEDISVFASERATRDGRASTRYELDRADLLAIDELFGAGIFGVAPMLSEAETFDMRAWTDDETGALAALELLLVAPAEVLAGELGIELEPGAAIAYRMSVALSDIDDTAIAIESPLAVATP